MESRKGNSILNEFDLHRAVLHLPAITRAGFVEALYVTELAGLLLIYWGYRKNIMGKVPAAARIPATEVEPAV